MSQPTPHPQTHHADHPTAASDAKRAVYAHRPSQQGENRSLKLGSDDPAALVFFVTAPRGLEEVLAAELRFIAEKIDEPFVQQPEGSTLNLEIAEGGVRVCGSMRLALAINLHSRIGNRVLWKIAEGLYRDDQDIATLARQIPWSQYFNEQQSFRVDTVAVFSPLKSIAIASLRVKDGLCDHFRDIYGMRPSVDKAQPQVRVRLFLERLNVTFYLDLSGEPLFKRGYRRGLIHQNSAPIRENVAAGLLMLMDWQPERPLYDPFCGSGTFLIEAARMALHIPSGGARSFIAENLLIFEPKVWQELRDQALAETLTPSNYQQKTGKPLPIIIGADADFAALADTRAQLQAWGWQDWLRLREGAFATLTAPPLPLTTDERAMPLLLSNPPYGERMGEVENLALEYPEWGRTLKHSYAGWISAWITGDPNMVRGMGLKPKRKVAMFNGDLPAQLLIIPLFAGKRKEHLSQNADAPPVVAASID